MSRFDELLQQHLKYYCDAPSVAGYRVAALLDDWQGLHHFDRKELLSADWKNTRWIEIKLSTHSMYGHLSTFDFSSLTQLVFLAHDHCIRVELSAVSKQSYKIIFHPRDLREGSSMARHPTLEKAVELWRKTSKEVEIVPIFEAKPEPQPT